MRFFKKNFLSIFPKISDNLNMKKLTKIAHFFLNFLQKCLYSRSGFQKKIEGGRGTENIFSDWNKDYIIRTIFISLFFCVLRNFPLGLCVFGAVVFFFDK